MIHTSGPTASDAGDVPGPRGEGANGGAGGAAAYDGARRPSGGIRERDRAPGGGDLGPSQSYFRVSEDEAGGLVIALGGEFDITSVGPLEATVLDLVVEGPCHLVFDLGDLTFMDPCGLAVLVTAARSLPVTVRRVPPLLQRMIELTGLAELLPEER